MASSLIDSPFSSSISRTLSPINVTSPSSFLSCALKFGFQVNCNPFICRNRPVVPSWRSPSAAKETEFSSTGLKIDPLTFIRTIEFEKGKAWKTSPFVISPSSNDARIPPPLINTTSGGPSDSFSTQSKTPSVTNTPIVHSSNRHDSLVPSTSSFVLAITSPNSSSTTLWRAATLASTSGSMSIEESRTTSCPSTEFNLPNLSNSRSTRPIFSPYSPVPSTGTGHPVGLSNRIG
mmetsp:Transcript_33213/g.51924  ORF Transcript_33213/g.51924 Transcript_33213/m.51924 type:complete len:234 (+) Transcript_33213:1165-1866(+)